MKFKFKDIVYSFPTSLSDITLGQRIDFNNQYGREIYEQRSQLMEMETETPEDEDSKDTLITEHYLDSACKTFSFFSGIPLEDVYKIPINQIVNVYENCMKGLLEQQEDIDLQLEFTWNDQLWLLGNAELNYESDINFNQFLTSKQIVKALFDLGQGQWEVLPKLCAIFLRRPDEEFDESWISETHERSQMMLDLPLDIALQVGFFLKSSMILFSQTFQSSAEEQAKDQI